MKKTLLLLIAIVATITATAQNKPDKSWKLVWKENFSKPTLDTNVWTKIPRNGADWGNYMAPYDELYDLENGKLILRGINNDGLYPADTAQFLTGGIFTQNKKSFANGRLEIYAKLGSAKGFWPAFWLLSQGAKWPNGGEIDIMEHLNHDDIIYQTLHSKYTLASGENSNKPPKGGVAKYNPEQWNLYAVELYQDSVVLFVNDIKSVSYPRLKPEVENQFPFAEQPFYLLLDAQLGGSWVGPVDPKELPVEMQIDWVKFYQKKK